MRKRKGVGVEPYDKPDSMERLLIEHELIFDELKLEIEKRDNFLREKDARIRERDKSLGEKELIIEERSNRLNEAEKVNKKNREIINSNSEYIEFLSTQI